MLLWHRSLYRTFLLLTVPLPHLPCMIKWPSHLITLAYLTCNSWPHHLHLTSFEQHKSNPSSIAEHISPVHYNLLCQYSESIALPVKYSFWILPTLWKHVLWFVYQLYSYVLSIIIMIENLHRRISLTVHQRLCRSTLIDIIINT